MIHMQVNILQGLIPEPPKINYKIVMLKEENKNMSSTELRLLVAGLILGIGLGSVAISLLYRLAGGNHAIPDDATLNALAACLENEASEACRLEWNGYGYEVTWRMKGE